MEPPVWSVRTDSYSPEFSQGSTLVIARSPRGSERDDAAIPGPDPAALDLGRYNLPSGTPIPQKHIRMVSRLGRHIAQRLLRPPPADSQ